MKANQSFLLFAFLSTLISVGDARAGGICINDSDCSDDGLFCNGVPRCIGGVCQAQPPPDCSGFNGPCSVGVCSEALEKCRRDPINEGLPCSDGNPCTTGETCSSSYCVGTRTINCCTLNPDCNDHNPCTIDVCDNNVCGHAPRPPGTPCGSSVNDGCTDPDTCNASGQCLPHDTPDGEDCGGPDCLAGQCGATTYRAQLLPEGGNIGSEPRAGARDVTSIHIVGRVIDAGSVDHTAAWKCNSTGGNCTLTVLPEGGAGTSVANGVACNTSGTCLAVGAKGSPEQPAVWVYNGVMWTAESVPLPGGFTGGSIRLVEDTTSDILNVAGSGTAFTSVGETVNPGGFRKATYWVRNAQGAWSVFLLDDFGVPGRESVATDLVQCDVNSPPGICANGELLIAGMAVDGPGIARPVVWRESGPFTGTIITTPFPLPAGAVGVIAYEWDWNLDLTQYGPSAAVFLTGTVVMVDGTTRGVVWKTADFQTWSSAVLPPLLGRANTRLTGNDFDLIATGGAYELQAYFGSSTPTDGAFSAVWGSKPIKTIFGSSYSAGGDPLTDGVATGWAVDLLGGGPSVTLTLTSGPADMNTAIIGLPVGCRFSTFPNRGWLPAITPNNAVGSVVCPSAAAGGAVAGITPPPKLHATIVIAAGPAGIPAVSTWGMAVMTLLVLCAATIVIRRSMRRGQAVAG